MSNLTIDTITAPSGGAITIPSGNTLTSKGLIIQTVFTRTDARSTYSAPNSGNGTTITDLNISITPKFANSLLIMRWMINCEIVTAWDTVLLVHRNGALITTAGYEAYNTQGGNNRWSGVMGGHYDVDSNSTMGNYIIQYAVPAGSTTAQTFAPAVRSASGTAYTLYLNRTVGSTGQDVFEVAISNGVIWEVAQ